MATSLAERTRNAAIQVDRQSRETCSLILYVNALEKRCDIAGR